ncbi:PAS domain S-box-containing protein [Catalinimonas alkaloidigena]|uniref:histidine kinase n=1 Tax=Catalinimonas alkaloidigena TaxID=1075417 RepID=A0A1G9SZF6_9BACT|nr:PAS domain S-box-containing protein [Catalinimonas alkaloidigena]
MPVRSFSRVRQRTDALLRQVAEGQAWTYLTTLMQRWRRTHHQGNGQLLALFCSLGRQVLTQQLSRYTTAAEPTLRLTQELDRWYQALEQYLWQLHHAPAGEESLQYNRHHVLEKILASSPAILFIYDLQAHRLVYANRQVEDTLGYALPDLMAMERAQLSEFVHPDDLEALWQGMHHRLQQLNGAVQVNEFRIRDPHQQWRWFRAYVTLLRPATADTSGQLLGNVLEITDQKNAQEELIQSRDYYLTLLEDFPALVWRIDASGELNYINRELRRFRGQDLEALRHSSWDDGLHPDDVASYVTSFRRAYQHHEPFQLECRGRHHSGEYRWMLVLGRPLFSQQGTFTGFLGVAYDLNHQKELQVALEAANEELRNGNRELLRTQHELQELNQQLEWRVQTRTKAYQANEERYRAFVQQSSEGIWRFEFRSGEGVPTHWPVEQQIDYFYQHGYLAECNDAMAQMYGFSKAEEITGLGLSDLLIREEKSNQDYLRAFVEHQYRLVDAESVELDRQGHVRHFLNNLVGFVEAGRLVRTWGMQRDITARKVAEESLKASEKQLRLITDALPVLITYVNAEGRYRFNNRAYEEWFGITREQAYDKRVEEVIGEEAYRTISPAMERAFRGESVYLETEMPYRHGGRRFVGINFIPDQAQGYYALITDISSQKRTQDALVKALQATNRQNQELNRINTDLDGFVYAASHDLRTPIANLEALLNVFVRRVEGRLDISEQEMLRMMKRSSEKLIRTIDDLAQFMRMQKEERSAEVVFFGQVLQAVREDLDFMIHEANVAFEVQFDVDRIRFEPKVLRRVLYNLLSNAVKYRSPERRLRVKIHTFQSKNKVHLTFVDNGLGIQPHQLSKLFKLFKRIHTHVEGTGIGLYMVKRMLENSGATIEVESEAGVGTTFFLTFNAEATIS